MFLVERHVIKPSDPRYDAIDCAAFFSKNLYNAANYQVRQAFFGEKQYLSYRKMDKLMQPSSDYQALPRKVSQWILRQLHQNWKSFFEATKAYKKSPTEFVGRPKLPGYKPKQSGRNLLVYTLQAISQKRFRESVIRPSGLPIEIHTKQTTFQQIRIVPRKTHYVVEVIYKKEPMNSKCLDLKWYAGVDIGLDNLAAVTSNKPGFVPVVVNGRPLKSTNQFYNQRFSELQSVLPRGTSSRRMNHLTDIRNRRIQHDLHRASRWIVDLLTRERIGVLVIGKNPLWKQGINLGRRNNQNFVQIPHARFIDMLVYKAELLGIRVVVREESYTSKVSFLDLEPVEKRETYMGQRVKRGLFIALTGRRIQADVNGSYNILRKEAPCAFDAAGVEGAVVRPVRITLTNYKNPIYKSSNLCL